MLGFTTNPFLLQEFGFGQGFDVYRFFPGREFAPAERVVAEALDVLQRTKRDRPVFLWVHLMEPHSPYVRPAIVRALFPVRGPSGPLSGTPAPFWLLPGSPSDLRHYRNAYDAKIAAADIAVESLTRGFIETRARRPPVIVVTADHGEEFLEHGGWEHSRTLYDELLRVPLVMVVPGYTPRVVREQVQLIDVFPTLVELGRGVTPSTSGHSLVPLMQGAGRAHDAVSQNDTAVSIRSQSWKLIAHTDGRRELFDLGSDPGERRNVLSDHTATAQSLLARLEELQTARHAGRNDGDGGRVRVAPSVREQLRALGYVQP